jgi:hypothetical protein
MERLEGRVTFEVNEFVGWIIESMVPRRTAVIVNAYATRGSDSGTITGEVIAHFEDSLSGSLVNYRSGYSHDPKEDGEFHSEDYIENHLKTIGLAVNRKNPKILCSVDRASGNAYFSRNEEGLRNAIQQGSEY